MKQRLICQALGALCLLHLPHVAHARDDSAQPTSASASASEPNAAPTCDSVLARLKNRLLDATCFDSSDLTTNNLLAAPAGPTTPANNTLAGLPPFAFTPATDAAAISPSPAKRTPITKAVPGLQIQARIAGDPTGQGRFLLRLPANWNGRLVVAGASGTRSEFNGDIVWSDYVVQQGYAYASQNKGVYNARLSMAEDPLGCRLNPTSTTYVHFYDDDPGQTFARWTETMVNAAKIAREGVQARYGNPPRFTYAVGTSNGGYQVRRAIESAPQWFDGGVDWEGTYIDSHAPNLLTLLPAALANWSAYVASGFDANSVAATKIRDAGYPQDIVVGGNSFWGAHWAQFWEVTMCQWQKRFDPGYNTYGAGLGAYNYTARMSESDVAKNLAAVANTGRLTRPLITVAGTMDALLPANLQARAYARKVRSVTGRGLGLAYRLYEVQNGNHIDALQDQFPQLALIEPHAHKAFDLLVQHVETHAALPPDQCIAKGGAIEAQPARQGLCADLFVP